MARYTEYLHGQTRELLTQFGKVDVLWYDFSYERQGQGAVAEREAASG